MTPQMNSSLLEDLPDDLLREIITRVGAFARRDVGNVMLTSTELARHARDDHVSKKLTLRPLASNPLWAMNNYAKLMERCLASGNLEAHYIKGILQYFQFNDTVTGLEYLKTSASGSYDNGIYLYGIIMLCRGQIDEGKAYLDKLEWKTSKVRGDRCWRHIRRSLQGIPVMRKRRYFTTLRNNRPPKECHLNDMDTRCNKCYYYKQMRKFVGIRTL